MWPFKKRRLEDVLFETKKIKVHGIKFEIRRVNPVDFLRGAKVFKAAFDTYKTAGAKQNIDLLDSKTEETMKTHIRDVFMSSVKSPILCYAKDKEQNPSAIVVDNLFTDMGLSAELYNAIIEYSYGKKKRN